MKHTILLFTLLGMMVAVGSAVGQDAVTMNLTLPEIDWALQFELDGFEVTNQAFLPDMAGRSFEANNMDTGLVVSIFIEPAVEEGDAKHLRDYTFKNLKRTNFRLKDVEEYEKDSAAFLEYTVEFDKNLPDYDQVNLYKFMVKGDKWITVHLSRMASMPEAPGLMENFMDNVKIVENYPPTSIDHFIFGGQYYSNENYTAAARHYQQALDLEEEQPYMPDNLWIVLVDQLAMSYGIPGNHEKASEILHYGISVYGEYPMFYYNLACAQAELGMADSALVNLRHADEYRDNMLPGEMLPNPGRDPSLESLRGLDEFQALLKEW